ncbi:MAG: hypothetical protein IJ658_01040 [Kiritimatiellae bacterium]|nr:hypothetical protein [Kiritimatiellia bacterium]
MRKYRLLVLALTLGSLAAPADATKRAQCVYDMYHVWPRHCQLRQDLVGAIRSGDAKMMESVCRSALEIMPADATWRYNLACALAYRDTPDLALAELDKAIDDGFRDADAIAKDGDLARIAKDPRFARLVEKARALKGKPVDGQPDHKPATAPAGSTITINETNIVWNFDAGVFNALVKVDEPGQPLPILAARYSASKPTSPERPYVAAWLSGGSGAGNTGDLYVNRDGGHSMLAVGDFPNLTSIQYDAQAKARNLHLDIPNTLFGSVPVFGNLSRGRTKGAFWRSMARISFTDPGIAARMDLFYRNNQFWVLPSVNDVARPDLGIDDAFPANAPFQFVSFGASWSDQPFIRAALAASASFRLPAKQAIVRRHLLAPTMQWLLRRTQKGVNTEEDYLSPSAHPTAFDAKRLDVVELVKRAHELKMEEVPPAVSLALVNSRLYPIKFPAPGRDYPDTLSELLFATPSAISMILRAPDGERTYLLRAQTFPETDPTAVFAWRVVHGPADAVKISAPLGEPLNGPESGFAQITIDRRQLTNRIDVACFAKSAHTTFGAPAIISFFPIPQEKRTYRPDGQIAAIDYTNPDRVYSDPAVALPRHWTDTYDYTPDGKPLGFTRSYNGEASASFTAKGERIVERNPDGSPKKLVRVKYTPRGTGDAIQPVELTYIDDGEPYEAKK